MKKVGLVGWRGMVGSVLIKRMLEEGDFKRIIPYYLSTSIMGQSYVDPMGRAHTIGDARSIFKLAEMDMVISCQGSAYTQAVYKDLRGSGWQGYWIDAASAKRMDDDSVLVLDPVNRAQIDAALDAGVKNFIGANCAISLTLLGLCGLFRAGLVEWISMMTYQAASGAGAVYVRELLAQMKFISDEISQALADPSTPILTLLNQAHQALLQADFPQSQWTVPLSASLIPWIDSDLGNGMSREEWKGEREANKILGLAQGRLAIDGLCVRIGTLQCHSAAITMKLKQDRPLEELTKLICDAHPWIEWVSNNKKETIKSLSPAALSGSLKIGVGRLRKLNVGEHLYSVMTVGDQLLWGAAEPLRRMLGILIEDRGGSSA